MLHLGQISASGFIQMVKYVMTLQLKRVVNLAEITPSLLSICLEKKNDIYVTHV